MPGTQGNYLSTLKLCDIVSHPEHKAHLPPTMRGYKLCITSECLAGQTVLENRRAVGGQVE
jgi:hypothetical protein